MVNVLGNLNDLDIDLNTGKIEAIIIANNGKVMQLLGQRDAQETVIPWKNILKIGSDVILVELPNQYKAASTTSTETVVRK